jgi:hypothetical protein
LWSGGFCEAQGTFAETRKGYRFYQEALGVFWGQFSSMTLIAQNG